MKGTTKTKATVANDMRKVQIGKEAVFCLPKSRKHIGMYLARIFQDVVNADSVIYSDETDWFFKVLVKYEINRIELKAAEEITFAEALNKLRNWKHDKETADTEKEKTLFLKWVYEDLCSSVLGESRKRRCSKFEASILAAFEFVVQHERAEIFNPSKQSSMHFNKDEIIYLDRGLQDTRSISKDDYRNISHAARLVNSRFIYVPHIRDCFVNRTDAMDLKRLLAYLYPSSLPKGVLESANDFDTEVIEALYAWLNSKSLAPFVYRVIGEQLFGNNNAKSNKDDNSLIECPMLVMKLRTSRVMANEKMESRPDFLMVKLKEPSNHVQGDNYIAKQVMNVMKLWLKRLKMYAHSFDIHVDYEAESHFLLHTFHKNIFDAMILGSEVKAIVLDFPNDCLNFKVANPNLFENKQGTNDNDAREFTISVPMTPGPLTLYLVVLCATLYKTPSTTWCGLRYFELSNSKEQKEDKETKVISKKAKARINNKVEEGKRIIEWVCDLVRNKEFGSGSLLTFRSDLNKFILQTRLINNKAQFCIVTSDKFWRIDLPKNYDITVVYQNSKGEIEKMQNPKRRKKPGEKEIFNFLGLVDSYLKQKKNKKHNTKS